MPTFMKYLADAWRCANLYRSDKLQNIELNVNQYPYIIQICKNPGILQEQLSKIIFVHKSNVARQLSSLEEKGFIYREVDQKDRRNFLVFPTQKALKVLPMIQKINNQWISLVLEGISQEEQEAILKYSKIISDNAKRVIQERKKGEENQ